MKQDQTVMYLYINKMIINEKTTHAIVIWNSYNEKFPNDSPN